MSAKIVLLLGLLSCLVVPLDVAAKSGRAGHHRKAKRIFRKAQRHFQRGAFTRARNLYQRAYRLTSLPGFLLNIGLCHYREGNPRKALRWFRRYLAQESNPSRRERVAKLIQQTLEDIETSSPNAAPPALRVVSATATKARDTETKDTNSSDTRTKTDESKIERAAAPPHQAKRRTSTPGSQPPPASLQEEEERSSVATAALSRGSRGLRSVWFWTGVGVGGTLLAGGAISWILALQRHSEYENPNTSYDRLQDLKQSGETLHKVGLIALGSGAAVTAATVVLYFLTDFTSAEEAPRLSLTPATDGAMVTFGGRY